MRAPVTIRDIARAACLSPTAVSVALRNHPDIKESTRDRIKAIAKEMGYVPNPLVSALMADQRRKKKHAKDTGKVLAVLTQFRKSIKAGEDVWYENLFHGVEAQAVSLGYKVEEFCLGADQLKKDALDRILTTRSIRGILLFPGYRNVLCPNLSWEKYAVMELQETWAEPVFHRAEPDYRSTIDTAFDQLLARGYKRIGLALGQVLDPGEHYGYSSQFFVRQHDLKPRDRVPNIATPMLTGDWQAAFREWVVRYKVDAILSHQNHIPDWISLMGLKMPEDVGFVNLNFKGPTGVGSTAGVDQRGYELGSVALQALVDEMMGARFGLPKVPKTVTIRGEWVEGSSIRPPAE